VHGLTLEIVWQSEIGNPCYWRLTTGIGRDEFNIFDKLPLPQDRHHLTDADVRK